MELSLVMQKEYGLSARQACRALRLSRSAPYYRPVVKDDEPVIEAVSNYVAENPGQGFFLKTTRHGACAFREPAAVQTPAPSGW